MWPKECSGPLAEASGGQLHIFEGLGPGIAGRWPVAMNIVLREFFRIGVTQTTGPRPGGVTPPECDLMTKRALYISSPIGLGHALRDVAIAKEMRELVPGLEIDWLAQHPVTTGARGRGRAHSPGKRAPGQRVGAHRVRIGRARPALLSGLSRDGRDPGRQLHALLRRHARGGLRPLDRRRGLGGRPLPARAPRAEASELSPG